MNLNMFNGLVQTVQQFSCSLCYFVGTRDEYERHKTCALHSFNYTLKYFTEKRPSIVKNRHGVEIETMCNNNISHLDNMGTNIITLLKDDIKRNESIELIYRITNTRKTGMIYVRNVLQLHPHMYFDMYHKYQEILHSDLLNSAIMIEPKRSYPIKIKFYGPVNHISTYRVPIAFIFQIDMKRAFTLIREMVVVVEDRCRDLTLERPRSLKKIYTGKSWINSEIIPANIQSDLDKEFLVPREYRRAILTYLKLQHNPLQGQDLNNLQLLEKLFDCSISKMNRNNYSFYNKVMLWMEEMVEDRELRKYNMEAVTIDVSNDPMKPNVTLEVPGLAEKRPSLVTGDRVHIRIHQDEIEKYIGCKIYEGVISKVLDTSVEIDDFNEEFMDTVTRETLVDVRFIMSRLKYQRMHRALAYHTDYIDRLYPQSERNGDVQFNDFFNGDCVMDDVNQEWELVESHKKAKRQSSKPKQWITEFTYMNRLVGINTEQKLAIENIVNKSSGIAPYILFGPPGTGKTVTIVEAIVQIIKNIPDAKILVCAPANMACDLLTSKLIKYFDKTELIRIHSATRDFDVVPKSLYEYSNLEIRNNNVVNALPIRTGELSEGTYKIVVCTLMLAGKYTKYNHCKPPLKFTHLVIDEAAQCMETETLIPIGGLLETDGQLILAGDPKQLGPICQSHIVQNLGLGLSMMERLMLTNKLYESKAQYRDHRYITKLVKNFRSHPDIIYIPNKFFYDNELKPASGEAQRDPIVQADIWDGLAFGGRAIEFYGVSSSESRHGRSPSYFNLMEKDVVIQYVKKLLTEFNDERRIKPAVQATDIGIISPYIKQVYKIKGALQKMGSRFNGIEVGSTEAFQGREKRIMIISTVRGRSELLEYDKRYNLGFLVNEKRFNVALTRAKSKLIIVGNPLCLTYNEHWLAYMQQCDVLGRYLGFRYMQRTCDLMQHIEGMLKQLKIKEQLMDGQNKDRDGVQVNNK